MCAENNISCTIYQYICANETPEYNAQMEYNFVYQNQVKTKINWWLVKKKEIKNWSRYISYPEGQTHNDIYLPKNKSELFKLQTIHHKHCITEPQIIIICFTHLAALRQIDCTNTWDIDFPITRNWGLSIFVHFIALCLCVTIVTNLATSIPRWRFAENASLRCLLSHTDLAVP